MTQPPVKRAMCLAFSMACFCLSLSASAGEIEISYSGPRCLTTGRTNTTLVSHFTAYFEQNPGHDYLDSAGYNVFTQTNQALFPEFDMHQSGRSLEALALVANGESKTLVMRDLPVLVSPFEIVLQYPDTAKTNWLQVLQRQASLSRRNPGLSFELANLYRVHLSKGRTALLLEFDDEIQWSDDVFKYRRQWGTLTKVSADGETNRIYTIGRQLARGSEVKQALLDWKLDEKEGDRQLYVHPGGILGASKSQAQRKLCAYSLSGLGLDAVVPRSEELTLDPKLLVDEAQLHGLPYIATNLYDAKTNRRVFPPFVLRELPSGEFISIIGLVGQNQLNELTPDARSAWKLFDSEESIKTAQREMYQQLGRMPDLVVVLQSGGRKAFDTGITAAADIVITDGLDEELIRRRERIEVAAEESGRFGLSSSRTLLVAETHPLTIGRIISRFRQSNDVLESPRLVQLDHEVVPVVKNSKRDEKLERRVRALEERDARLFRRVIAPDIRSFVEKRPHLHPYIWGPKIPHRGGFRAYSRSSPAKFTEPLWMKLVGEALSSSFDVDAVVSRGTRLRRGMELGTDEQYLDSWLQVPDTILVMKLPGKLLKSFVALLRKESERERLDSVGLLYQTGLDLIRQKVAGRSIVDLEEYSILITDYVKGLPQFAPVMSNAKFYSEFLPSSDQTYAPKTGGVEVRIKYLMLNKLKEWSKSESGRIDVSDQAEFSSFFTAPKNEFVGRWQAIVEELSVDGSNYQNNSDLDVYAMSTETRAKTASNYSLGVRTKAAVRYDDPNLSWENRLRAEFAKVVFEGQSQADLATERIDDIELLSELQLNFVGKKFAKQTLNAAPYIKAAFDTEFTPTSTTSPRQKLLRGSLGVVASGSGILKQIRLGALVQADFSDLNETHSSLGFEAGYSLVWPFGKTLDWQSQLDTRYLFPTRRDTVADLGFFLSVQNRFRVPVMDYIRVFAFSDFILV
ncbi:MAG: hypothetical protein VYC39_12580, partial [Myxococcota bacterium]|nr:hypothetical protein [Myxococcota bacterium]